MKYLHDFIVRISLTLNYVFHASKYEYVHML